MAEIYIKNYQLFEKDDLLHSKQLADELKVCKDDFDEINNWFKILLENHRNQRVFDKQLEVEKTLFHNFEEILTKIDLQGQKYILPKLLKYNNIISGDFLRSLYIARLGYLLKNTLISLFLTQIKPKYSVVEFISILNYLKNNFQISPNGDLLENIFKIEKLNRVFKKALPEQRLVITMNITHIIKEIEFHHDINCYKKILFLLNEEDTRTIEYLKKFEVLNNQGCYFVLNELLNTELQSDVWSDFNIKRTLIKILDKARGAKPNEKWIADIDKVKEKISEKELLRIADKIIDNEGKKSYYFNSTASWSDDVMKRFLKSANWIKQLSNLSS